MNTLKLLRLPAAFLGIALVLTGFYIILLSGLGIEKVGYLPQVLIIGVCLVFANSLWFEMFSTIDCVPGGGGLGIISEIKVSMSSAFILAVVFDVVALMLSMTVSLITFFVVCSIIISTFLHTAIFRDIAVFDSLIYALEFTLLVLLGMSAHTYLIYIFLEPYVYIPLLYLFLYVSSLRLLNNLNREEYTGDEGVPLIKDYEGESIELSTELDSVAYINDHKNDFSVSRKRDESLSKLGMSHVATDSSSSERIKRKLAEGQKEMPNYAFSMLAVATIFTIPISFCWLYAFPRFGIVAMALLLIFLAFPLYSVVLKKNISAVKNFYVDGIIGICVFNGMIILAVSISPFSKETLAVTGIITGLILPLIVLKKYFDVVT